MRVGSSARIESKIDAVFFWQEEYGVFSFDGKRLPNYIAYVELQKEHHVQQTTIPILERTEGEAVGLLRESVASYALNNDEWRCEFENLGNVL